MLLQRNLFTGSQLIPFPIPHSSYPKPSPLFPILPFSKFQKTILLFSSLKKHNQARIPASLPANDLSISYFYPFFLRAGAPTSVYVLIPAP